MFLIILTELGPFFAVAAVALLFVIVALIPSKKKEKKEPKEEEKPAEEVKEEPKEEEKPEEEPKEEPKEEEKPEEEVKEEPKEEEKPEEEPKEEPKEEEKPEEEVKEEPKEEEKPEEEPKEEPKEEEKPEEEPKEEPKEEEKPEEEKKEEKAPKVAPVKEPEPVEKAKTSGKWVIKKKSEEDYVWNLIANNGEIILASESYTTAAGAKAGLENIKESINQDRFHIHSDKNDHFFFKLKNGANKLQGMGQVYNTKQSANNSISSVKRFSETAEVVEDIVEELTYVKYNPKPLDVSDVKDAYRGKWLLVKVEDDFQAKLQASNGEIILVTERYASASSVTSAIENIKKNAADGNFVIDKDKNNRFFYRLRNDSNSTLAIGETYEKQPSCLSAIESVRRFSATAELVESYKEDKKEEEK